MKRPIKIHMLAHAWLLLLLCALSTPPANADVTIWVTGPSSAPYVMGYDQTNVSSTNSLNNTQLTDYVYKNGRTWYYKTFQGSSISGYISLGMSANSWSSPDITVAQGDNYYYYDGSNTAYYLNPLLGITDKESYLLVVDEYNALDNWAKARITVDSEYMTMVGGTKASGNFATYAWSSSNTKSGTISFDRRSEDGSSSWNTGSQTYTKGATYYINSNGVYPNTATNSLVSTYSSYVVPTTADIPTVMYLVGIANKLESDDMTGIESWKSQNWAADKGFAFTRNDNQSRFELKNVQLLAGATFGLATQLGASASETQTQADGRYYPVSTGNFEVGLSMALKGTAITMNGVGENSKTGDFYVTQTGLYDIYVNDNGTVEFHNATDKIKLHLIGEIENIGTDHSWHLENSKLFRYAGGTNENYQLKLNCQLRNNRHYAVTANLSRNYDNTAWDWGKINTARYAANSDVTQMDTPYELVQDDDYADDPNNNTPTFCLQDPDGSDTEYSNYVITVDVINNEPVSITFTKKPEGVSKVTVYLEKTNNVANPVIYASTDNGNRQLPATELTNVAPTSDNREWYAWEIDNPIADIYFTADGNKTSPTMSRKTGKLYYTWNEDNTVSDYTRDYYNTGAGTNPTCAVQLENGEYYVYFINTLGWKNVYCYAWKGTNTELLGQWPGTYAMLVGFDENDNEVWTYNFGQISGDGIPTEVIFNDGGSAGSGQQTGDLTWVNGSVYDMLGSVSLGRTLALALALEKADGRGTTSYTIDNELTAVYYDEASGLLYCKDDNDLASSSKSLNTQGATDYMVAVSNITVPHTPPAHYDQSNWIALRGSNLERLAGNKLTAGKVKGTISIDANGNAVMDVTEYTKGDPYTYKTNIYTPASFFGEYQSPTVHGHTHNYFFVQPKNMEYATITWAKLDEVVGDMLTFTMPDPGAHSEGDFVLNTAGLEGSFVADLSMNTSAASAFEGSVGEFFTFESIIKYPAEAASPAPRRGVKSKATAVGPTLMVYPTNLTPNNSIITSVSDVNAKRTVSRVTYVSPAGMRSAEPFEGVNIVITTYTDGTTSASKILK